MSLISSLIEKADKVVNFWLISLRFSALSARQPVNATRRPFQTILEHHFGTFSPHASANKLERMFHAERHIATKNFDAVVHLHIEFLDEIFAQIHDLPRGVSLAFQSSMKLQQLTFKSDWEIKSGTSNAFNSLLRLIRHNSV